MIEGRLQGQTTAYRIQQEALGKYADCFMDRRTGLWYASTDARTDDPFNPRPRKGALPRPEQDTPTLTARVYSMHERAARRLMIRHLRPRPRSILQRLSYFISDRIDALLP